jgi:hypothetical protein
MAMYVTDVRPASYLTRCSLFILVQRKQYKRTIQTISSVTLQLKLLHTVTTRVSYIHITSLIERQSLGPPKLISRATTTISTHHHNSTCFTFRPLCNSIILPVRYLNCADFIYPHFFRLIQLSQYFLFSSSTSH